MPIDDTDDKAKRGTLLSLVSVKAYFENGRIKGLNAAGHMKAGESDLCQSFFQPPPIDRMIYWGSSFC